MSTQLSTESGPLIATKLAPGATVSVASFAGVAVSDILMWATLFYTLLLIGDKMWRMYRRKSQGVENGD